MPRFGGLPDVAERRETGVLVHGETVIPYRVSRSARRKKTIAIKVAAATGVEVMAPRRATLAQIHEVVALRMAWIVKRLAEDGARPAAKRFIEGECMPYRGEDLPLRLREGSFQTAKVALADGAFCLSLPAGLSASGRAEAGGRAFRIWYREAAKHLVADSVARWAPIVGETPAAVYVRDQRARWGSCGADGTLRLSLRLAMLAPELLDYVVVHELCHLRYRNHAKVFWDAVAAVLPGHLERRAAIRAVSRRLPV